jgi:hypothetical protein
VTQAPAGIRCHAAEVDAASCEFDEEQHIQASKPDGVDGQKVTGDDRRRLRVQELRPAQLRPSRRRLDPVPAQNRPDGTGRDPEAKPDKLALDAPIAPGRILTRASRSTSSVMPPTFLGRPTVRREYVQRRATSSRCQRRSVAGDTNSVDHAERGSERLSAANSSRSAGRSRGRVT